MASPKGSFRASAVKTTRLGIHNLGDLRKGTLAGWEVDAASGKRLVCTVITSVSGPAFGAGRLHYINNDSASIGPKEVIIIHP